MTRFLEPEMTLAILDQTKCELGEGPTYDPQTQTAWWFDIVARHLYAHPFKSGKTTRHQLELMASMLGVVDDNTQMVATEKGLYLRQVDTGTMCLHHPIEADNPLTRSNDGRVHPCGAIWIGTMGKNAQNKAGGIYWFFKGELRLLFPEITIPNGICFSPDGSTAYFTDSMINRIMQLPIDPKTALPLSEPEVLYDHNSKKGVVDGAVTDQGGDIWFACWGASRLHQLSPRGKMLASHPLPVTQPTCPAFVGERLDKMIITSAWQGKADTDAKKGNAGKTLLLDLTFSGKPEPRVVL
jgi:sugar lactone lactonase YvrE